MTVADRKGLPIAAWAVRCGVVVLMAAASMPAGAVEQPPGSSRPLPGLSELEPVTPSGRDFYATHPESEAGLDRSGGPVVPEPSGIVLAVCGAILLLARRGPVRRGGSA